MYEREWYFFCCCLNETEIINILLLRIQILLSDVCFIYEKSIKTNGKSSIAKSLKLHQMKTKKNKATIVLSNKRSFFGSFMIWINSEHVYIVMIADVNSFHVYSRFSSSRLILCKQIMFYILVIDCSKHYSLCHSLRIYVCKMSKFRIYDRILIWLQYILTRFSRMVFYETISMNLFRTFSTFKMSLFSRANSLK